MANHSISRILTITILTLFVIEPVRGLGGGGGKVGGRTKIEDVGTNKEIQDLGKYSVKEYNRLQRQKGANGGDLKFRKVVEAEKQVVAGIKYYLKISATSLGGVKKTFDAEVVVQPWKKTKQLLNFEPSTPVTK